MSLHIVAVCFFWLADALLLFFVVTRVAEERQNLQIAHLHSLRCPNCLLWVDYRPGMADYAQDRLRDHMKECTW